MISRRFPRWLPRPEQPSDTSPGGDVLRMRRGRSAGCGQGRGALRRLLGRGLRRWRIRPQARAHHYRKDFAHPRQSPVLDHRNRPRHGVCRVGCGELHNKKHNSM